MKYLFFGGAQSTGKTKSITRLKDKLIGEDFNYKLKDYNSLPNEDFQCILEKDGKKVLMHSCTDLKYCIDAFFNFYCQNKDVDVVIISIRDEVDPMRKILLDKLSPAPFDYIFEIPLGKVRRGETRGKCIEWYNEKIDKLALQVIENEPFNLLS